MERDNVPRGLHLCHPLLAAPRLLTAGMCNDAYPPYPSYPSYPSLQACVTTRCLQCSCTRHSLACGSFSLQLDFSLIASLQRLIMEDVDNTKSIARLVPIFLCLPAFWALFDQQGSAWVEQARDMNLMGMEPEQMNVLNPSTWGGRLCCRCWICEGRGSGEGGNGIQMVVSAEGEVQGAVGFIWHRTIDSWCFRDEVTGFYCVCRVLSTHEQRLCL